MFIINSVYDKFWNLAAVVAIVVAVVAVVAGVQFWVCQ